MTIEKATDIVRKYFLKQCNGGPDFYLFKVNNAIRQSNGLIVIWCTHSCFLSEYHHRVAVSEKTGVPIRSALLERGWALTAKPSPCLMRRMPQTVCGAPEGDSNETRGLDYRGHRHSDCGSNPGYMVRGGQDG